MLALPSQLLAGNDGVVVGEGLLVDAGSDVGQQAAAAVARFGCGALLEAAPVS